MSKKIVIWGEGQRNYEAEAVTPNAVLVPKGKENLVPEGAPYISILGKPTKETTDPSVTFNKEEANFNVTETLVTFEMFEQFCIDTAQDIPSDQGWGRGKRPIINVTSISIFHFCNWLSERCAKLQEDTGVYGEGVRVVKPYILQHKQNDSWWIWLNPEIEELRNAGVEVHYAGVPTDAQWKYMLGNAQQQAEEDLDSIAWYADNSNQMTHPVAEKKPNNLGIHDVLGNVWKMVLEKEPPFMTPALWVEHKFPGEYMDVDWFGTKGNNTPTTKKK